MNLGELMESLREGYTLPEEDILAVAHRDARALVLLATLFGWTVGHAKGKLLVAEDGTTMQIPTNTGLNSKVFRSRANTIMRHACDEPLVEMPATQVVENIIDIAGLTHDHARVLRESLKSLPKRVKQPVLVPSPTGGGTETGPAPVVSLPPEPPILDERRIMQEEPWTAHGRNRSDGSETYPSDAVMERLWSDETTDYACRWPDCDYTGTIPRSVAAHYGSHAKKAGIGRSPQPAPDGLDTAWTPTQAHRIRHLRRELEAAFAAARTEGIEDVDLEWIAAWVVTHRVDDLPKAGGNGDTSVSHDEGPLTAEQILDRIAALADRGRAHVLREQIVTLNDMLDKSEASRARMQSNLDTLTDLITGLKDTDT